MAIKPNKRHGDFTPAPEGLHRAVCVDVVDLGLVKTSWQGQESIKPMIKIVWQTEDAMPNGKPYMVSKRYTNSSHPKASLRQHCESWRGKKFTDAEFEDFDLEKLIGANCQLQVVHNQSGGDVYANVGAVVPAPRGAQPLKPREYTRFKDRPDYQPPAVPAQEPEDEPQTTGPEDVYSDDIPF